MVIPMVIFRMPRTVLIAVILATGFPAAGKEIRTFQDLRYEGVVRQGDEPSCAAASVVTILNHSFGEALVEGDVWLGYLQQLDPEQQDVAMRDGLSIMDMVRLIEGLGYRAHATRISLMGLALARTRQPAIVYVERGGSRDYRHFLVFDGLDGSRAVLRDPAVGNRRVHIEHFLSEWRGHAIFVSKPE